MLVLILEDLEDFALLPLAPLEPRMLLEALDELAAATPMMMEAIRNFIIEIVLLLPIVR